NPVAAFSSQKNAFQPREWASRDLHSPANRQERMRLSAQALGKSRTQDSHLFVRKSDGQSVEADQSDHTRNLHHAQPVAQRQPHTLLLRWDSPHSGAPTESVSSACSQLRAARLCGDLLDRHLPSARTPAPKLQIPRRPET